MAGDSIIKGINDPYNTNYNQRPSNPNIDAENFIKVDDFGNIHTVEEANPLASTLMTTEYSYNVSGNVSQIKTYPSGMSTGNACYTTYWYNINDSVIKSESKIESI
jgi:hypothetical protein